MVRYTLSRREALLVLLGASSMHIWSSAFGPQSLTDLNLIVAPNQADSYSNNADSQNNALQHHDIGHFTQEKPIESVVASTLTVTETTTVTFPSTSSQPAIKHGMASLTSTTILAHAPGWTLFRNIYMMNGTLFIVTDQPFKFPEIRMMTSTGLEAINSPENIALREPTADNMAFLSPDEARTLWGDGEDIRVWTVQGNTVLFNDPQQFLRHYYHFVAELLLGVWAFWHGVWSEPVFDIPPDSLKTSSAGSYHNLSTTTNSHYSLNHPPPPPLHRVIFAHSDAKGWRDGPGLNAYWLRAAFPSLTVEVQQDWDDRVIATRESNGNARRRAWHFPSLLLTDRSAAHRGVVCGSQTQRTAAEAWDSMRLMGKLRGAYVGGWWAPVREAVWRFAGVDGIRGPDRVQGEMDEQIILSGSINKKSGLLSKPDSGKPVEIVASAQQLLPPSEKVVITYITRQSARGRKLIATDHQRLVEALNETVQRRNENIGKRNDETPFKHAFDGEGDTWKTSETEWELQVLEAENMSLDEQVRVAARTTILIGVHGNGLTHLVLMPPTRSSTVIEIFYPGGFAHDYQWTTKALGMVHFGVWNDTHFTGPNEPRVEYPDGFQGNEIPVFGPMVAQLIEDRVDGKL